MQTHSIIVPIFLLKCIKKLLTSFLVFLEQLVELIGGTKNVTKNEKVLETSPVFSHINESMQKRF